MNYLYIDESGSMTTKHFNDFPYFVICIIHVLDKNKLKRKIKRYVSKNFERLKLCDTNNKMFKDGHFLELKGSCLTKDLKISLVNSVANKELFEVFYIVVNNNNINEQTYKNKARAFNYLLELCLSYNLRKNNLPNNEEYCIQIDERNVKTDAKKSLEDYLYTSLSLKEDYLTDVIVSYFDSSTNSLIQLSDVFSNIYYSYLMNQNSEYSILVNDLLEKGIIKNIFKFPLNKK